MPNRIEKEATSNTEKGLALARAFFPPCPPAESTPQMHTYPELACTLDPISKSQIKRHL